MAAGETESEALKFQNKLSTSLWLADRWLSSFDFVVAVWNAFSGKVSECENEFLIGVTEFSGG